MSAESISALASVGTFIVIAVTAIAALVQLRHLQASNQIASMIHTVRVWESPEFQEKVRWTSTVLPEKLNDPTFVSELRNEVVIDRNSHPELSVADLWEQTGAYIKHGLIVDETFFDICAAIVARDWERLVEVIRLRREAGGDAQYENFEYLAARSIQWKKSHPANYPPNVPRLLPKK